MFLNALSNRGLLSQQNGKFVYVGDKPKQQTVPPGNCHFQAFPNKSFYEWVGYMYYVYILHMLGSLIVQCNVGSEEIKKNYCVNLVIQDLAQLGV